MMRARVRVLLTQLSILPSNRCQTQVYVERQRLLKSSSRVPSAQSINLLHTFPLILVKNKM